MPDMFVGDPTESQTAESYVFENEGSGTNVSHEQIPDQGTMPRRQRASIRQSPPPSQFYQTPRSNFSNPFNSVLTMPIPGTKLAPEKFRGDFHKVKEFIQHYERLCIQNNVVLDLEKCETILRYCSKREKQTIKNIPSFISGSWGRLREDILRLYDADLDTRRYKVKDVRNFSKAQKTKKIKDLGGWKKYCRAFLRIAGSLLAGGKITDKEYATYFWQGIPRPLRQRIEGRILVRNPTRDLSEPFEVDEMDLAATAILQRDRFDRALDDSDSDEDSSANESSSEDSDDESSESESEDEKEKRRRRARKQSRSRKSDEASKREESRGKGKTAAGKKRIVSGGRSEVVELIHQMNLLTRDDPEYGLAYYQALKLDPDIARVVSEPALQKPVYQQAARPKNFAYQAQAAPYATGANAVRPRTESSPMSQGSPPPRAPEMTCYGCGDTGHGMGRCKTLADLIARGLLTRDSEGRIMYPDGSWIRRNYGETYLQAFERERASQSHLVMIDADTDYERFEEDIEEFDEEDQYVINQGYDDEDRNEDVFAVRDANWRTYVAERPEKQIAAKKRMVMDGVYPPRLKDLAGGKENRPVNEETGRPVRPGKAQPARSEGVREIEQKSKKVEPVPVEVHQPRYDPSKDSHIVEDKNSRAIDNPKRSQNELPNEASQGTDKRAPRKSAITERVNVLGVLDQLLNAKVELAVGEVIGISREVAGQLSNVMKLKSVKGADSVNLTTQGNGFQAKSRGLLIKITLECDGRPIEAIVDTGSQLNIINEKISRAMVKRPIDCAATMVMSDANGGKKKLLGLLEDVPFDFGGVRTRANLYVGEGLSFDLLLGRPWQRGNLVTIDEVTDGTYLIFKDPETREPRHKVLVTPDANLTRDWNFEPSTWMATDDSNSYFIEGGSEDRDLKNFGPGNIEMPSERLMADYPHLNEWEFPNIFVGGGKSDIIEIVKPWMQRILLRALLRPGHKVTEWDDKLRAWIIKEYGQELQNPPVYTPALRPEMEIKVGPATVQHEAELPSLFASPATARAEAEELLAGLGNIPHYLHDRHLRNLILTTRDGVIVGYSTDASGFRRTDLMLFNMGLVASKGTQSSITQSLPDVQYGTGVVHFYPNLGGEAPANWEIPYLFPAPPQASVSPLKCLKKELDLELTDFQAEASISVSSDQPPAAGFRPISPLIAQYPTPGIYNHDESDLESNHEVALPCRSCLTSNGHTCAARTSVRLNVANLPISCLLEIPVPSPPSNTSSDAMPALEDVDDDSDDSMSGSEEMKEKFDALEEGRKRWTKFKESMEREHKHGQGGKFQDFQLDSQEARQREREEATAYALKESRRRRKPNGERSVSSSSLPTCTDSATSCAPKNIFKDFPADFSTLAETSSDERRLESDLDNDQLMLPPPLPIHLGPSLDTSRAHYLRNGKIKRIDTPLPTIATQQGEDSFVGISQFDESLLFVPEPVRIYSVFDISTNISTNKIRDRPPTPFPESGRLSAPLPSRSLLNGWFMDPQIKKEEDLLTIEQKEVKSEEVKEEVGSEDVKMKSGTDEQTLVETPGIKTPADSEENEPRSAPILIAEQEPSSEKLPSPSDTEIIDIEEMWLPRQRQLPRPPVELRPDHYLRASDEFLGYQSVKEQYPPSDSDDDSGFSDLSEFDLMLEDRGCFLPHIISMTRDRVLYPFTETIRTGPRTDLNIPIRSRPYIPYADMDVHYNIQRVQKLFLVDVRDLTIARPSMDIPVGQTAVFSLLAPRNSPSGLVFPGLIWPSTFGPLDLPQVVARTLKQRFEGLRKIRTHLIAFVARIREILTPWQIEEIESPVINLFMQEGQRLVPRKVRRSMFFRIMHPTFNPLLTEAESTFLRGACYALRKFQHDLVAEAIDHTLRAPQLDVHMCQSLLRMGCLDRDDLDDRAYHFLEEYEAKAQGDLYEGD